MATKSYPVNGRDTTYQQWDQRGTSPQLDQIDTNSIIKNTTGAMKYEGDFSFADSESENENTLNSVVLRIYGYRIDDMETFVDCKVSVWNGSAWSAYMQVILPYYSKGYATDIDVSAILDTWEKLDGAKIRFSGRLFLTGQYILVDYAELKATYTEAGGPVQSLLVQVI